MQQMQVEHFGIVFKVFAIVLAFSLGVAVGGQPIIGFNYGAKKYDRVLKTYKSIIIANVVVGIISMLLFELVPGFIVNLFGGNASNLEFYQEYACLSFRIYLGGILLCCIQKSSCIFLQSIDKPFKAMILSLMRDVIILVPGVCILGLMGDLYKMLWAGPLSDICAFVVTVLLVSIETSKIKKLIKNEAILEEVTENENKLETNVLSNFVITIGREFGSGGKYIGEELAKLLNVKCYDNELISEVASDFKIDEEILKKVDEKQKSSFWYSFATNYVFDPSNKELSPVSAEDNLFLKQAKVIEEIYNRESAIIIGRCSDYILKGKQNVINVFIYSSDEEFKVNRKMKYDHMTKDTAIKTIKQIDTQRANYYKHFTSQKWGDKENYDLCIDTSKIGVIESINLLEEYIKKRIKN